MSIQPAKIQKSFHSWVALIRFLASCLQNFARFLSMKKNIVANGYRYEKKHYLCPIIYKMSNLSLLTI